MGSDFERIIQILTTDSTDGTDEEGGRSACAWSCAVSARGALTGVSERIQDEIRVNSGFQAQNTKTVLCKFNLLIKF